MKVFAVTLLIVAGAVAGRQQALDLSAYQMVDLTHAYGPSTVFWPT